MSARTPDQISLPLATSARDFIHGVLAEIYAPRDIPTIDAWLLSQKLQITADQNPAYAGQTFDPARNPVVARLIFKFFETPDVFELFCLKPVQSMVTTHVWFALCHSFIHRPCTAILVMHTRQEVRKKKKDTYAPIIAALPELATSERVNGTETTAEEFRFTRSTLYVGGGQSASVLTSTPAKKMRWLKANSWGACATCVASWLGPVRPDPDTGSPERHLYYFCEERVHYLEHVDRSTPGLEFTLSRYAELWAELTKLNETSIARPSP